jgi:uncharacterized DUF497 family protein
LDRIEGGEQRWQTVVIAGGFRLLMVAHTMQEHDIEDQMVEIIWIISARRVTKR